MSGLENRIANHYSSGTLLDRIIKGLSLTGINPDEVSAEDLKPVDEFHIGGNAATEALLEQIGIAPQSRVLDIGSGIGGPARFMAVRWGAKVHGVDLTPEFVETARELSKLVGIDAQFSTGSALALPVEDDSYDIATLIHVGMNIPDKAGIFSEAARALRPDGIFAVYEVMRTGEGDLLFPVPWAETPELSFLDTPQAYATAARDAGFEIVATRNRKTFALEFFNEVRSSISSGGPSPLGLQLLMGATAKQKIANMITNLEEGIISPVEMICRLRT